MRDLKCAVIVAHPDDETLWAGGTILMNPLNDWTIITICRKSDSDRSPKFSAALKALNAEGKMGDINDGPGQVPVDISDIEATILPLLGSPVYDLIITHSTQGEYTRHRRHEEVAEAVIGLVETGRLQVSKLWMFAYEDGNKKYLPMPINNADQISTLPQDIWNKKYQIITEIYGFQEDSWEAKTTPIKESFWIFNSVAEIQSWKKERGKNESTRFV
ncbi:MAG: PIG-L family deacetylase [Planctomycetota bacterium]|jgi:LmbE family N-acetylglucosaminyl deacetylase